MSPKSICSPSESSSSTKSWIVHGIVAGAAIAVAVGARAYLGRSKNFRSRVVGIIPARFASSRFEGKPLVNILGKPMIQVPICPFALFFMLIHRNCRGYQISIVFVRQMNCIISFNVWFSTYNVDDEEGESKRTYSSFSQNFIELC